MKTRREFFRTLAGSCAVVAACVIAPKSLIAKPKQETHMLHEWEVVKPVQVEEIDYATSGYASTDPWQTLIDPKEYDHVMQFTNTTGWTTYKSKWKETKKFYEGALNG